MASRDRLVVILASFFASAFIEAVNCWEKSSAIGVLETALTSAKTFDNRYGKKPRCSAANCKKSIFTYSQLQYFTRFVQGFLSTAWFVGSHFKRNLVPKPCKVLMSGETKCLREKWHYRFISVDGCFWADKIDCSNDVWSQQNEHLGRLFLLLIVLPFRYIRGERRSFANCVAKKSSRMAQN